MGKDICVLYANCQGDALRELLELSPDFSRHFQISQYQNYGPQSLSEADLNSCRLFLHQYLSPKWGDFSTEKLLPKLASSAENIILPNFFFKGYWPFWTDRTNVIEFADILLEELLSKGLDSQIVLDLYLKLPSSLAGDLEKIAQESILLEKEKEKLTPIKYTHIIEENWRRKQLFLTINHPDMELIAVAAQSVLSILGFPPLPETAVKSVANPVGDFWLPIHPVVGKRLQLNFAVPERLYQCFGKLLTHREYIYRYLACREHGIADLTGVLKALAESSQHS